MNQTRMQQFMERINQSEACAPPLESYASLHRWSVEHKADFWEHFSDFAGIIFHNRSGRIFTDHEDFWQQQWFKDCRLNYAENLLRFSDEHGENNGQNNSEEKDHRIALVFSDEQQTGQEISYEELRREVGRVAEWLKQQNVKPGDRVAGFVANRIETIIAMLATASLGAVWSSCSPDFGVQGVLDRFGQIEPTVLVGTPSHSYNGKILHHGVTLSRLLDKLPSVRALLLFPDLYPASSTHPAGEINDPLQGQFTAWDDIEPSNEPLSFHSSAFNDPLFIMYSSGTTGKPKCIVHGTGGTLIQHMKEHSLHVDLSQRDTLFYFTTCGWMMWNWLASGLAMGAKLVLYDGSPFYPTPSRLYDLIDEHGISVFGISAKFISASEKAGLEPKQTHRLTSLRCILSTGSPLSAEGFDYVYEKVSPTVALQSISGGTDIISCFVLGCPLLPIRRGEIQCAGLGMDVAIYDEDGHTVIGRKGELVCRQSFPSMPVGFWNDPEHRKYRAAYFSRFPGVWTHGDYAEQTPSGGYIIHGRSDTVLNPGGVRLGTAEIYRQVEQLPDVLESIVVAQDWRDDVRVILFVKLADDLSLTGELEAKIRHVIREGASPRHVPARILQVNDIPRTVSGKIVELAVRAVIHGDAVSNTEALANPEALEQFRNREELRR